jgi:uncharacterized Ntn-hydrolase superfamily protein
VTWSLIARDGSGAFGVAVASRFFAVGALCPHAARHVGAVATQALVNPLYARDALDARGKQAAALIVCTTEDYPALDLRVDDHAEPIVELRRLYEKSLERFQPFVACLPSRANPAGITDRALIETEIERFQAARPRRPIP